MNYLRQHSTRRTPQSEPMPGSTQVENNAGGYVFALDEFARLRRFLILGAEGGTFYVSERRLVKDSAAALEAALAKDGQRTVELIAEISDRGLARDNDIALFCLAGAAGHSDEATRRAAFAALPKVARTGTHILHFAAFLEQFRGWGPMARKGVGAWYTEKPADRLAYQLVKYRQRDGWSHRDVLRVVHPEAPSVPHAELFEFVTGNPTRTRPLAPTDVAVPNGSRLIEGFKLAQVAVSPRSSANLIREYGLPREAIRPEHLGEPVVLEALLQDMPITAMIRNLANLTRAGVVKPLSEYEALVVDRLNDENRLRRGRVHPLTVLSALRVYAKGVPIRGHGEPWTPSTAIIDALDGAFYKAFENVQPSGKRTLLAFDVSGSMRMDELAGVPGLSPREGAAAMGLVTAASEPTTHAMAFSGPYVEDRTGWGRPNASQREALVEFPLSARERIDDVVARMQAMPFGGTDCAVPMLYATRDELEVDTFIIYTDNETWAGAVHPMQALREYREKSGIAAKLIVVGMTATGFSIADPDDAGALDVVGFDASAPAAMAAFARGEV